MSESFRQEQGQGLSITPHVVGTWKGSQDAAGLDVQVAVDGGKAQLVRLHINHLHAPHADLSLEGFPVGEQLRGDRVLKGLLGTQGRGAQQPLERGVFHREAQRHVAPRQPVQRLNHRGGLFFIQEVGEDTQQAAPVEPQVQLLEEGQVVHVREARGGGVERVSHLPVLPAPGHGRQVGFHPIREECQPHPVPIAHRDEGQEERRVHRVVQLRQLAHPGGHGAARVHANEDGLGALGLHHPGDGLAAPGGGFPVHVPHRVSLGVVPQAGELAALAVPAEPAQAQVHPVQRGARQQQTAGAAHVREDGDASLRREGSLMENQSQRTPHPHVHVPEAELAALGGHHPVHPARLAFRGEVQRCLLGRGGEALGHVILHAHPHGAARAVDEPHLHPVGDPHRELRGQLPVHLQAHAARQDGIQHGQHRHQHVQRQHKAAQARKEPRRHHGQGQQGQQRPQARGGNHRGTSTDCTTSRRTSEGVAPSSSASGDRSSRCLSTGPARKRTSSGVTKCRPRRAASALAARSRCTPARGPAPRRMRSEVRVADTSLRM
ncbi:hypothetical protein STIAU_4437 [Stigmatella aurantiaca DW4/3-1]|uniref:Uncharacterized protein n=1 Tax=Stigmatella aurantiaca (strain DW4/3-1) TaxID=378806 RepID=Q08WU6_STIAD|nr:hypothetical protein STIAU_4437 [Stigmatella aurantiaca DW4/3-1]